MNYRSDRDSKLDIYLNEICIASRHFEIRQMQGQELTPSARSDSPSLKIGWQERVTLHYLVVPIERTSNALITFSTLSFSSGNKIISGSLPRTSHRSDGQVADFMCRERAHEMFIVSIVSFYCNLLLSRGYAHPHHPPTLVNSAFTPNRKGTNTRRAGKEGPATACLTDS